MAGDEGVAEGEAGLPNSTSSRSALNVRSSDDPSRVGGVTVGFFGIGGATFAGESDLAAAGASVLAGAVSG